MLEYVYHSLSKLWTNGHGNINEWASKNLHYNTLKNPSRYSLNLLKSSETAPMYLMAIFKRTVAPLLHCFYGMKMSEMVEMRKIGKSHQFRPNLKPLCKIMEFYKWRDKWTNMHTNKTAQEETCQLLFIFICSFLQIKKERAIAVKCCWSWMQILEVFVRECKIIFNMASIQGRDVNGKSYKSI